MNESRILGFLVELLNSFGLSLLIPVGKLVPLVFCYIFYIGAAQLSQMLLHTN